MKRLFAIVVLAMLASASLAASSGTGSGAAVDKAADWLDRRAGRIRARGGRAADRSPTGRIRTCVRDGEDALHLVEIDGGGFVAVSAAEDARILGFSPSGEMPGDDATAFWALVAPSAAPRAEGGRRGARRCTRKCETRDTIRPRPARRAAAAGEMQSSAKPRVSAVSPAKAPSSQPVASALGLDDVRVSPLVQSAWDQRSVAGKKTYNYYTPGGCYCGCVATAMAQVMRFHRYPQSGAEGVSYVCYTNSSDGLLCKIELSTVGGEYEWDSMPLKPASAILDAEREQIGRICFDAGVSVHMQYSSGGSGTYVHLVHEALVKHFGYAFAEYCEPSSGMDDTAKNAILANLDAGLPVILGISDDEDSGHAIVADGYGYLDGVLYCHLNMGWSGANDYWYPLPEVSAGYYDFTSLDGIVYNIMPSNAGEIVSGRVSDPFGNPLCGVSVAATIEYRVLSGMRYRKVSSAVETATDDNGIYAFLAPTGKTASVSISASSGGWSQAGAATSTKAGVSPQGLTLDEDTGGLYAYSWTTSTGNSWGNDFVFGTADGAAASATAASIAAAGADGFAAAFSGTAGAWYALETATDLSNPAWERISTLAMPSGGTKEFSFPVDAADGARFYRLVPMSE